MDMGFKVDIFDGCHPVIAMAIETFNSKVNSYSVKSRKYSIYRLLIEEIDPAIQKYSDSLPTKHRGLEIGIPGFGFGMGLGELSKKVGFYNVRISMRTGLMRFIETQDNHYDSVFIGTVDTLIGLVIMCAAKAPKKTKPLNHDLASLNARRQGDPLCKLCGNKTELSSYLDDGHWPISDSELRLKLSAQYCSDHKPENDNESVWNPVYKQGIRSKAIFNKEVRRIHLQACHLSTPQSQSGDILVDQYIWNYVARICIYPDEESEFRKHARNLVDNKITDKKKSILMLVALGKSQSDIARYLKISRQSVSKAIKSIPLEYRLDINENFDSENQIEKRKSFPDIDQSLLKALYDSMVITIGQDSNGKLWQEKFGEPIQCIGNLSKMQTQALIDVVANYNEHSPTNDNPILDGKFPLGGYRITTWFPPIVRSPSFTIRKKTNTIISPNLHTFCKS